jgi:hypothetical protein
MAAFFDPARFSSIEISNVQALGFEGRRAPMRRGLSFWEVPSAPLNDVRYALNCGMKADLARGRRWAMKRHPAALNPHPHRSRGSLW